MFEDVDRPVADANAAVDAAAEVEAEKKEDSESSNNEIEGNSF